MTEAQRKRYYFPAWQAAAGRLGWRMRGGRLEADLAAQYTEAQAEAAPEARSPGWDMRMQVIAIAEAQARQLHRAVTADDLRHACNLVASQGRVDGSDRLRHAEVTRAVQLFRLVADPDDLAAVTDWDEPDEAARRDLVRWMERQPARRVEAYRAIARNRWPDEARPWTGRCLDDLRWLMRTAGGSCE